MEPKPPRESLNLSKAGEAGEQFIIIILKTPKCLSSLTSSSAQFGDIKRQFFPLIYQVYLPKRSTKKKAEATDFQYPQRKS